MMVQASLCCPRLECMHARIDLHDAGSAHVCALCNVDFDDPGWVVEDMEPVMEK